ncbi:MAG: hypothetical protein IJI35_05895, partial [Kiritimatiellae bacterium]|nr:hypothetical protein [Kiritimatiellia bacterium]
ATPEEWSYSIAFSRTDGGIIDAALPSDAGGAVSDETAAGRVTKCTGVQCLKIPHDYSEMTEK